MINREEKIDKLVAQDIEDIRVAMQSEDYEFLTNVLRGNGWKGYDLLTDGELNAEYKERFDE